MIVSRDTVIEKFYRNNFILIICCLTCINFFLKGTQGKLGRDGGVSDSVIQ